MLLNNNEQDIGSIYLSGEQDDRDRAAEIMDTYWGWREEFLDEILEFHSISEYPYDSIHVIKLLDALVVSQSDKVAAQNIHEELKKNILRDLLREQEMNRRKMADFGGMDILLLSELGGDVAERLDETLVTLSPHGLYGMPHAEADKWYHSVSSGYMYAVTLRRLGRNEESRSLVQSMQEIKFGGKSVDILDEDSFAYDINDREISSIYFTVTPLSVMTEILYNIELGEVEQAISKYEQLQESDFYDAENDEWYVTNIDLKVNEKSLSPKIFAYYLEYKLAKATPAYFESGRDRNNRSAQNSRAPFVPQELKFGYAQKINNWANNSI